MRAAYSSEQGYWGKKGAEAREDNDVHRIRPVHPVIFLTGRRREGGGLDYPEPFQPSQAGAPRYITSTLGIFQTMLPFPL